jgi:type IV pilus assembly protein PilM
MAFTLPASLTKLFKQSSGAIFSEGQSVVGVDIGLSSIKMVQLRKEQGRGILETYGELAIGPYVGLAVGQAGTATTDQIVQVINDLIKEANVTATRGVFSIPLRSSLLTVIEIPAVDKVKLEEVVPLEARKYIPVPVSEVVLDWWLVPSRLPDEDPDPVTGKQVKKPSEVLVAAVHKDVMKQFQAISEQTGLSGASFEIETFSAIRAAVRGDLTATAVLDLGASSTKMTIVDFGVIKRSHTINKGAQDITGALSRSMNIEFAKAEEIKRKVGLVERVGEDTILPIVSPVVEYVFSEVNKLMVNYGQSHARSIDKIILLGGGALLQGLLPIAKERTGVEVIMGSPFNRVEAPAFLEPVLEQVGPSFAVATGLALRGLQTS